MHNRPKLLLYLAYFGLLSLINLKLGFDLIWLWVGAMLGWLFIYVDRLNHVYLTKPDEQLSVYVKHLVTNKRYGEAFILLTNRGGEQRFLMSRSVLFMVAFVPLALFVLTSTASELAAGMVLGIGLHLLLSIAFDWYRFEYLKHWLFWPIKRHFNDTEAKAIIAVYTGFFVLFSLFMV